MYTTLNKIAVYPNMKEVLSIFLRENKRNIQVDKEICLDELCKVVGLNNALKVMPTVRGFNKEMFRFSFERIKSIEHLFIDEEAINVYKELLEAYNNHIVPSNLSELHERTKPLIAKGLWAANGSLFFITENKDFKYTVNHLVMAVETALKIADVKDEFTDQIREEQKQEFLNFVKKYKKPIQEVLF